MIKKCKHPDFKESGHIKSTGDTTEDENLHIRERLGKEIKCKCDEYEAEIKRLNSELKKIKDLVETHGSGQEFDWAVLGEIDEKDTEIARLKEQIADQSTGG